MQSLWTSSDKELNFTWCEYNHIGFGPYAGVHFTIIVLFMQKCLDTKRSPFWSVFPFPDTLVNNPGDLWNIVVSYCVITRKLCYNTQVRNSFLKTNGVRIYWKFGKMRTNTHVLQASWFAVQNTMDGCFWSRSLTIITIGLTLLLIYLCHLHETLMGFKALSLSWLWDSTRPLLRIFMMAPLLPSLQKWRQDSTWGHARRFQPLAGNNLLGVVPPRAMHGSWAEANDLDLDG